MEDSASCQPGMPGSAQSRAAFCARTPSISATSLWEKPNCVSASAACLLKGRRSRETSASVTGKGRDICMSFFRPGRRCIFFK